MPRRTPLLLLLALTSTLATACASQQEQYCDAVTEHQAELSDLNPPDRSGTAADVFAAADVFEELAEEAPDDIADEWDLVLSRIDALETAVEDAGLDPATMREDDDLPAEVTEAADRLAAEDTGRAMADLEQQALDVCGTPLSR